MKDLSRRELIVKGLMAGGAAALGSMAATGMAAASESATSSDDFAWDLEADVVVLGFGSAGIAASIAASEAGCKVIVAEKMDEANAGGGLASCSGNFAPDGADSLKHSSYNTWSDDFAADVSKRTSDFTEWLNTNHPGMSEFGGEDATGYHAEGAGYEVYVDIQPKVAAYEGIDVEYGLAATNLVVDKESGEVLGVRAIRDDKEVLVKGKLGTIICTGGFAADPDFMHGAVYPGLPYTTSGSPAATADGIKMAMSVGAKIGTFALTPKFYNPALRVASETLVSSVQMMSGTSNGCIYVNGAGTRFCNEAEFLFNNPTSPFIAADNTTGYKNLPAWAVWDSTMFAGDPIVEQTALSWARSHMGYDWGTDNTAHGEEDGVISADTLEELAAKMTSEDAFGEAVVVDAEAFTATVDAYNGYVDAGEDADFARDPASMTAKLTTPPFYAIEIIPNVLFAIGGLDTDETGCVLDWNGDAIPRLYAAGDTGQGQIITTLGVTGCLARGQIAGEQAASLTSWEE